MQQIFSMIPILFFFIGYKFGNKVFPAYEPIIIATFCIVCTSVFSLLYHFLLKRKQEKMAFYSNIAIVIFGSLTVFFHNPMFIKVKITLINLCFGFFMLWNYFSEKPSIQKIFDGKISMENHHWRIISLRIAVMFFIVAIGNEIVYRNFTESFWVQYKVFYVPIFSMIYFAAQIRFILKNNKHKVLP